MPSALELQFQLYADELMKTVVIALFANPNRPRLVGSAFLVELESQLYLVSARHVFDEMNVEGTGNLFFYVGLDQVYVPSGRLLVTRDAANGTDDADVGVMRLSMPAPAWANTELKHPISIHALGGGALVAQDSYLLLAGYPASKTRIHTPSSRVIAQPHALSRPRAAGDLYTSLEIDPRRHVLVSFDQRRDVTFMGKEGQRSRFPSPQGMSGAPLWLIEKAGDGPFQSTIVGIATTHLKVPRLIKSTHIDVAIEMMMHLQATA